MNKEYAVTFDDVLIVPKFSKLNSRKDVDLTVDLGKGVLLGLPVISANMETITGSTMAQAMDRNYGLGILHRFCTIEDNIQLFKEACFKVSILSHSNKEPNLRVGVSIGVGDQEKERATALIDEGAKIICIDVAHGAQSSVVEQVKWLRGKYGQSLFLIVGNFATPQSIEAFELELFDSRLNPDLYKVGIGPGSVCTTRVKTGIGVPQMSAILACAKQFPIIADGGLKTPGDIAKALGAGAKAVMIGSMLAGTDESPPVQRYYLDNDMGEFKASTDPNKITYGTYPRVNPKEVIYKGSASDGYGNGWKTSEGVEIKVPCKGPVDVILNDIQGGLRSALTYTGSSNLTEFKNNCEFILVSNSTKVENGPHGRSE